MIGRYCSVSTACANVCATVCANALVYVLCANLDCSCKHDFINATIRSCIDWRYWLSEWVVFIEKNDDSYMQHFSAALFDELIVLLTLCNKYRPVLFLYHPLEGYNTVVIQGGVSWVSNITLYQHETCTFNIHSFYLMFPSTYLSVYLPTIYLFVCLSAYLSVCLCLTVYLPTYPSICLPTYLSVCLSLSACLSVD